MFLNKTISPLIITASRATDIPAFYSNWFFNRLSEGYFMWKNPFNGQEYKILLNELRLIVFWSKNPKPIVEKLHLLDQRNLHYMFQFTLNDYEREGFECDVPALKHRIESFKMLSMMLGKNRMVWRFDPLILSDQIDFSLLLLKVKQIGEQIHQFTTKLIVSFLEPDKYLKVKRNLLRSSHHIRYFTSDEKKQLVLELKKLCTEWGIDFGICADEMDFSEFGIQKNKCVDERLIQKAFSTDVDFIKQLSQLAIKDKGQRKFCNCIPSKDIGQYNTCIHACLYCYATISVPRSNINFNNHNFLSEYIS